MTSTARSRTASPRTKSTADTLTQILTMTAATVGALLAYSVATSLGIPLRWCSAIAAGVGIACASYSHLAGSVLRPRSARQWGAAAPDTGTPTVIDPQRFSKRLASAIRADAAERAAGDSWHLDRAHELLGNAEEWTGTEDGTARFALPFGCRIHYQPGPVPETAFTFVSAAPDKQTVLRSLPHLQELLEAAADSRPVDVLA